MSDVIRALPAEDAGFYRLRDVPEGWWYRRSDNEQWQYRDTRYWPDSGEVVEARPTPAPGPWGTDVAADAGPITVEGINDELKGWELQEAVAKTMQRLRDTRIEEVDGGPFGVPARRSPACAGCRVQLPETFEDLAMVKAAGWVYVGDASTDDWFLCPGCTDLVFGQTRGAAVEAETCVAERSRRRSLTAGELYQFKYAMDYVRSAYQSLHEDNEAAQLEGRLDVVIEDQLAGWIVVRDGEVVFEAAT